MVATGSTEAKRQACLELGAEAAVDAGDPAWTREVRRLTGKRGVDLVVEHVGGKVLEQVFGCLARGGTVVTCGATAGREVTLNLWPFFVKQQRLIGSYGRTQKDLETTLEWAAAGRLKGLIDREIRLEALPQAYADLHARRVRGKVVGLPSR